MPKALDLTGQKFGHLEPLYISGKTKHGKILWRCKCDCGNVIDVVSSNLVSLNSTSCGCTRHEFSGEDLTDRVFGKWRVLSHIKESMWLCECECGTRRGVSSKNLKNGLSKSCGCTHNNMNPYKNLLGKKFTRLTVIAYQGKSIWKCRCDCGKETLVKTEKLTSGHTKSCGCARIKEIGERAIQTGCDLTGSVFGSLTVIRPTLKRTKGREIIWECKCECGNLRYASITWLKRGIVTSCGCKNIAVVGSKGENEIKDFINQFVPTEKAKKILDGKEIDIFIPSFSLGIEYNGSLYHASKNSIFDDKHYLYHRDKFLLAKERGIHLISIFDVDWENNKEKIKMYLSSILSPQKRLMARKCKVCKIDEKIACDFVDKYHIQGSNNIMMKINYGLYYEDELYAVMSFGKLRLSKTQVGQFELHRYCVKNGYTIVGGANKLLRAFENEYKPNYILSYSDNDYFMGGIYERLGFTNKGQCRPRYYWFLNGLEFRRERCMLKNLRQTYPDLLQEAYDVGASNKEDYVMTNLGACKVYRSGNTKWEKNYEAGL